MEVFTVEIKVSNWQEEQNGEEIVCQALVDTGALYLCLPQEIVERLKLKYLRDVMGRLADGKSYPYRLMGFVNMEVQGRLATVNVLELPRNAKPLLGAIPLEEMDWHIYPGETRLLPNP